MPKIYITYAITPDKELIISSYHEGTQSKSNAAQLARKAGVSLKDLKGINEDFPEASQSAIQNKLLELLTSITHGLDFNKVTYRGDLNLCTSNKAPTDCLFDGTLNRFFSGKEVHLILESANKEYVEEGIQLADRNGLTGAIIQTKTSSSDKLSKFYPAPEEQLNNNAVPIPDQSALAQDTVNIRDPQTFSNALAKIGVFNTANNSNNAGPTEEEKISPPRTTNKT
ncbi:hypothetical protein [Legionella parisiensis]|uniref:Uncharacterized protein n=1 Tax=Legionella parisiensis TaxID=45071 RepID=A0A1E5JNA4_9GAMM|nr:hypothetical protein [Legionella parisiensis]KTD42280.1 hypothetical protein Lpar_3597 [Legionella parisiensis]OEH45833.1 hypothetical protein lpari_03152 [Legionella parisiensis]STX72349.1 Uncharacterised protein [Legionella parisiensis]